MDTSHSPLTPTPLTHAVRAAVNVGSGLLAYTRPSDVPAKFRWAHRLAYSVANGAASYVVGKKVYTGRDDLPISTPGDDSGATRSIDVAGTRVDTDLLWAAGTTALTWVSYDVAFRITEKTDDLLTRLHVPAPRLLGALATTALMYGVTALIDRAPADDPAPADLDDATSPDETSTEGDTTEDTAATPAAEAPSPTHTTTAGTPSADEEDPDALVAAEHGYPEEDAEEPVTESTDPLLASTVDPEDAGRDSLEAGTDPETGTA
ncbi:hypothetical protein [Brevibacterium litoralis]|uniref:hypothetical protein n=1 Tax=Brevibacterium litoralis TaxID=3138935 RepID=UPI0032EF6655